jgi:phosphotransferase system enzyme I (PtsI)
VRERLQANGIAKGLVLGPARLLDTRPIEVRETRIDEHQCEAELERLEAALTVSREQLHDTGSRISGLFAKEILEFIEAHLLLLEDPELTTGTAQLIRSELIAADYALKLQRDRLTALFEELDDPYLRARGEDIHQVFMRVLRNMQRRGDPLESLGGMGSGDIVVTHDLPPAELAQLHARGVAALVCESGSPLSHTAILARSLRLPLVIGAHGLLDRLRDGDPLLVDGATGELTLRPDAADIAAFHARTAQLLRDEARLARLRSKPSRTLDGRDIQLFANADFQQDATEARKLGAAGIGLFRTEFLYLNRRGLPDEDEQFEAYLRMAKALEGRPLTVRTLDIGADKAIDTGLEMPVEVNPALGMRGLRLSLKRPEIFRTQLRAALRAASHTPVRVLLPMLTTVEEARTAQAHFAACQSELAARRIKPKFPVSLGGMIEVPSAALAAREILRVLDFVSVGTNDLLQYLVAVDRNAESLSYLYDPLNPALLKLLSEVIRAGERAGKPVALCGELAARSEYTPMLLALGLTEFSLHPGALLEVKRVVLGANQSELLRHQRKLLAARDSTGIRKVMGEIATTIQVVDTRSR